MKFRLLFVLWFGSALLLRAVDVSAPMTTNVVAPYILTPPAPATPRINGASVFGVRPGSPFLYTIPATGERPMEFSIEGIPDGLIIVTNGIDPTIKRRPHGVLKLNPVPGQITGSITGKGEYKIVLVAKNSQGEARKNFRIVVGDQIALTPPMGWNSWNCFAHAVSQDKVKSAADAMVKSGLNNHGWSYINVDDYWQNHRGPNAASPRELRDANDPTLRGSFRDAKGFIVPNSRFPDMKGMADYIHSLGLKAGLYSSPGPWTCGGCTGSFQHEQQDAATYAQWGFDYLKYDWCSYGSVASGKTTNVMNVPLYTKSSTNIAGAVYPYALMGKFLRAQKRDIVFSLCQYGMADVWQWGDSVNGNCWRTTGDITDAWAQEARMANWQGSVTSIGFSQDKAAPYAKPGNWNDPDMLVVGEVGWGNLHPSRLTPDEQYSHISLWCLLAAPLLIGCDMTKLDDFTLNLLCNDEVLALDQDELGNQATCVLKEGDVRVYEKTLADGGHAFGIFNLGATVANWELKALTQFGLTGKQSVRDLWRQKDISTLDAAKDSLPLTIPVHGVVLYKLTAVK